MVQTNSAEGNAPIKETPLTWKVHLLKRHTERLLPLVVIFGSAGACVWLMFHSLIPTLASLLLLVSATADFLFPVSNSLTSETVISQGFLRRSELLWSDVRRVMPFPGGVTLSPLATPSRLDAFRGVTLRFAPTGEPGDEASVMEAIERRGVRE